MTAVVENCQGSFSESWEDSEFRQAMLTVLVYYREIKGRIQRGPGETDQAHRLPAVSPSGVIQMRLTFPSNSA